MKKILKIALIVILIIVLVVGGYFIALNMTKKQAMDTVDKMFTALKTGDEEQIKQYINIKDVIEENATSEDNIADNQDMEKAMLKKYMPKAEAEFDKCIERNLRPAEQPYKETIIQQVKKETSLWMKCQSLVNS